MIHYLHIGYFEKDERGFGQPRREADGVARLVVRQPLDLSAVEAVLRSVTQNKIRLDSIPQGWQLWVEQEHLVCNHYTRSRDALRFVIELARCIECDLLDSNLYPPVTPEQLERILGQPRRWID